MEWLFPVAVIVVGIGGVIAAAMVARSRHPISSEIDVEPRADLFVERGAGPRIADPGGAAVSADGIGDSGDGGD
jgi:hypothetical protein